MSQDVLLHRGREFEIGEVRCGPADPELRVLGPIQGWCISFPRHPLELRARTRSRFIADGCTALLLAPGTLLDRRALSGFGSRCHWLVLSDALMNGAPDSCGPLLLSAFGGSRAIRLCKSPALTLLEHRLFRRAARASAGECDLSEMASQVVECATASHAPASRPGADSALADAARTILAQDPVNAPHSDALADRLGVSVFHLCRAFRRATGQTIQQFARRLRLDLALERLAEPDVDLSRLALDLGFSSHSHFSAAFRGTFGLSPSTYRERRRRRAIA